MPEGEGNLRYIYYLDDYPLKKSTCLWDDTVGARDQKYVVQTAAKVIQRCLVMTTDPGDLVLDITCGSGTTAYVAEQWGRRWITCDTSRVAITLAKQRLMTATFDYYKLAHPEQGIGSGLVYRQVPRIALKNIANGETASTETIYDQPEIDKTKIRISGPFTVEALPAPVVRPLDDLDIAEEDAISATGTTIPAPSRPIGGTSSLPPESLAAAARAWSSVVWSCYPEQDICRPRPRQRKKHHGGP